MKTKMNYVSPTVSITRVLLEEGVAIASPVNSVGLDGWDDNNGNGYGNGSGDTGDIQWGNSTL